MAADLLSDHRIVIGELSKAKAKPERVVINTRKFSEDNIQKFTESIRAEDIECILNSEDLETAVTKYEQTLRGLLDECMPLITKTVTNRPKVPWFNPDIKQQRQIVRNRERVWIKYSQKHQWLSYKRERNRYKNMINHHKANFYTSSVLSAKGDTKKLYQITNNIMNNVVSNPMPPSASDLDLSNTFADFFLAKIINIRRLFDDIPPIDLPVREGVPRLTVFSPITESKVKSLISDMKTKSCELDPIPTHLLKNNKVLQLLLPPITKIINLSLSLGDFSSNWKCAIVRPLLKKSNLDHIPKNYRPVSNLQFLSKLAEKAALEQFNDHCLKYKLIPDYQSAYREGYSCETAVLKLHNDILWSMENQQIVACVMLDLSAAFDTVDHDLLLRVLQHRYSIEEKALRWYDNYLRPRQFKVCVGESYSEPQDLTFSVPQGSASGANIFVGYCESLIDAIPQDVDLKGFADDHLMHKAFAANKRAEETSTILQLEKAFLNVKNWMDGMRLKLNPDKTEFILFGNQVQLNKCHTSEFDACGDTIPCVKKVKVLGTVFDSNMKFTDHINLKVKTALFNFRKIKEIRQYLTRDTCLTLILGLVMSHLDYNNAVLIGVTDQAIKKFQRIQNMCAKLVLNYKKYDSATLALKELHWLPIKLRIQYKILCITHRCLYHIAPDYLKNLLVRNKPSGRTLRSQKSTSNKLIVPYTKLKTFAAGSFSVKSPELWNELSEDITCTVDIVQFKKKLKTYLFNKF